jgi:pimeloyl-ACP methyl ester carboxylesterase
VSVDATHVLHEGAWRHRFVAANGARFHVAEAGPTDSAAPLVVLLHGFPLMWWCWRAQLPALAAAGYRAAALDLRGYGASDKPPRGYDTPTLASDVAAVVRSLGAADAVVVGHDWGGWIAWSMPALQPTVTRAVAALSAPHPLQLERATRRSVGQLRAAGRVLRYQLPIVPERSLTRDPETVPTLLAAGGGPGWPDSAAAKDREVVATYTEAMRVPFVAHSAMEYFRWVVRSTVRTDGRTYRAAVNRPVHVPVLQVHGRDDPVVLPRTARGSRRWAVGPYRYEEVPGGHFLPEERPDDVTRLLLDWLKTMPPNG